MPTVNTETKFNVATRDYVIYRGNSDTPDVAAYFEVKPSKVYWVEFKVTASYDDASGGGTWWRQASFRTDSASAITQIGSTRSVVTDNESSGGMDVTVAASGTQIQVTVTGVAATNIQWTLHSDIKEADYIPFT